MCTLRRYVRQLVIAGLLSAAAFSVAAQAVNPAGFQRLAVNDPLSGLPMEAAWFYPTTSATNTLTPIGPYDIAAHKVVPVAPGRYPMVVISHGNAGSLWGHHDLATWLAQHGYLVITLTHPGDNYQDQSGVAATSTLYGRPRQISAAISTALVNPAIAPYLDSNRIAFIGFSAGGETGLFLAGAQMDPARFAQYCQNHAHSALCASNGIVRNDRPDITPQADRRIKALVLMAPVSVRLSLSSLNTLQIPTLIFSGDQDEELNLQDNTQALVKQLASSPTLKVIKGAGHFVFLAPCPARLAAQAPALCHDPVGVQRRAIHQEINADIAAFFEQLWAKDAGSQRP